jgi:uncharacterized protein (DUF433 family)
MEPHADPRHTARYGRGNLDHDLSTFRFHINFVAMLDWSTCSAVERDPSRVSGVWTFRGTRVPVTALFENLESGARIDDFLAWFPGVSREQVEAVLEHTQRSLQIEGH